jgi:hypothetical protein
MTDEPKLLMIKLVSGEEVIGQVKDQTLDGDLVLNDPVYVRNGATDDHGSYMFFEHASFFSTATSICFKRHSIIFETAVRADLHDEYNKYIKKASIDKVKAGVIRPAKNDGPEPADEYTAEQLMAWAMKNSSNNTVH